MLTLSKNCCAFVFVCLLTSLAPAGRWCTRCEVPYVDRRVEPSHHSINSLIQPSGLNHIRGSQLVRNSLHYSTGSLSQTSVVSQLQNTCTAPLHQHFKQQLTNNKCQNTCHHFCCQQHLSTLHKYTI